MTGKKAINVVYSILQSLVVVWVLDEKLDCFDPSKKKLMTLKMN